MNDDPRQSHMPSITTLFLRRGPMDIPQTASPLGRRISAPVVLWTDALHHVYRTLESWLASGDANWTKAVPTQALYGRRRIPLKGRTLASVGRHGAAKGVTVARSGTLLASSVLLRAFKLTDGFLGIGVSGY